MWTAETHRESLIHMASNASQTTGVAGHSEQAPKRTRRRVPVSCNLCHSRKLKCNRQKPCSSCEIRGEGSKCEYASRHTEEEHPAPKRRRVNRKDDELQQRLDNLERLIVDAANSKTGQLSYPTPANSSDDQILTSANGTTVRSDLQGPVVGSLDTRGPHAVYAGDTAFHGILQEVCNSRICDKSVFINVSSAQRPAKCLLGDYWGLPK